MREAPEARRPSLGGSRRGAVLRHRPELMPRAIGRDGVLAVFRSMYPLLVGFAALGMGSGLLFTSIGVRLAAEGVSARVIGELGSGYFAGFLAGALTARRIVKRVGHVRAFVGFTAASAIAAQLHVILAPLWMWASLRIVMGFCLVGGLIVAESWVQFKTTNATRGRAFALYAIATSGGFAVGPLLINVSDPFGAGPFVLASILFSTAFLPMVLSRVGDPTLAAPRRLRVRELAREVPIAVAGVFAAGLVLSSYVAVAPVYAERVGMTPAHVSLFVAAMSLGGIIMQYPVGSLSDRFDRRVLMIVLAVVATGVAVIATGISAAAPAVLVALSFGHGAACQPVYGLSVAHANDVMDPERFVATSAGLLFVNGIGTSLGPVASAVLVDSIGPSGLFLFFGVVLGGFAVFAAVTCALRRLRPATRGGLVASP